MDNDHLFFLGTSDGLGFYRPSLKRSLANDNVDLECRESETIYFDHGRLNCITSANLKLQWIEFIFWNFPGISNSHWRLSDFWNFGPTGLQDIIDISISIILGISSCLAPPSITSINIGLPAEQKLNDLDVALARPDMQSGPAIQINAIDVDSLIQQFLDSLHVPLAGHEEQLHG
nr:hypothetical protein GW17_00001524 [Ipomoea batatas]